MKKNIFKYLFTILISSLFFITSNINAIWIYNINLFWTEKRLLTISNEKIDSINNLFTNKLSITCKNIIWNKNVDNEIKFICKSDWKDKRDKKAWCWFVRTTKDYKNVSCILSKKGEEKGLIDFRVKMYSIKEKPKYTKNLDISNKFYKQSIQQQELSCESSATSDIISTIKNQKVTEYDVIKRLSKSFFWRTAYWKWKDRYWWDPDVGFVGYLDKYNWRWALQRKYEGYWVYEKPLSKVYSQYWIKNRIINKFNRENLWISSDLQQLIFSLKQISEWNYIQMWWDTCTYPQYEDWKLNSGHITQEQANKGLNWRNKCLYPYRSRILLWRYKNPTTWEIKVIKWLNWEHAFYLLWYKWNIENPSHIIVWDTNTWKHIYPTSEWLRKWNKMDNRSILVYAK